MQRLWRLAAVALFGLLGGCADGALSVVNSLVPSDTFQKTADIAYGGNARQMLDVYRPKTPGPHPVVLFFYGGSWKYGARGQYKFLGEALASRGIVTVIADYRLYPEVKFPTFVEDAALALRWVRDHVREHDGDPAAIYVMGHSAGAQIAALVALNPAYAEAAGATGAVHGLIGLSGPYIFHPEETESIRDIFLGTGDLERARPINYADAQHPPPVVFLAHGRDDDTVYPRNTEQLAAKLRANGGTVRAEFYDGVGHIGMMAAFIRGLRGRAPVLEQVVTFINDTRTLQPTLTTPPQ